MVVAVVSGFNLPQDGAPPLYLRPPVPRPSRHPVTQAPVFPATLTTLILLYGQRLPPDHRGSAPPLGARALRPPAPLIGPEDYLEGRGPGDAMMTADLKPT